MSVHTKPVASKSVLASMAAVLVSTVLASSAVLPVGARESAPTAGSASEVALSTLPPQARQTHALILAGGPFPYAKDGSVFVNRERLLPLHPRGHYREYTVKTPGLSHRGARRIVCGGTLPTSPDACFYTADHYASFSRIVQ
jgi:ribonuclease T1